MLDLERGGEERVTSGPDTELAGAWLPDGRGVFYSANRGLGPQLVRRDLETGRDEDVIPASGFQYAESVSPDGRTLAFLERSTSGSGRFEAWTVGLDGSAPADRPLAVHVPPVPGSLLARREVRRLHLG